MAWMAAIALMDKQLYEESLTNEKLEKKPFLKNSGKWRSRELKEEAERALYGRNIIMMNEADHASVFGDNAGDSDSHFDDGYPPWPRYRYIRPIQVSVTDDIGRKWYMNIAAGHRYRTYQDEVERFRAIHADTHEELWHDIWTDMFDDLCTLPGLRYLEINLDQANCYHGCCRLAVDIIEELLGFDIPKLLEELVITGTRDAGERKAKWKVLRPKLVAGMPDRYRKGLVKVRLPRTRFRRGQWRREWPKRGKKAVAKVEKVSTHVAKEEAGTEVGDVAGTQAEPPAGTGADGASEVTTEDTAGPQTQDVAGPQTDVLSDASDDTADNNDEEKSVA